MVYIYYDHGVYIYIIMVYIIIYENIYIYIYYDDGRYF